VLARGNDITVRAVVRHALPSLVEGTVAPLVLFTVLVHSVGLHPALWGSLAFAYGALTRRLIAGKRIPGILVLSTVGVTIRLITLVLTSSAFLFFAQPVLATVATAAAFAISAAVGRPLTAKLGADLVPLPEAAWSDTEVRRTCARLAGVWAAALAANAGLTMWMLATLSVPMFVLLHPTVSLLTTVPAIAASIVAGRRVMRRSGARLVGLELPSLALPTGPELVPALVAA